MLEYFTGRNKWLSKAATLTGAIFIVLLALYLLSSNRIFWGVRIAHGNFALKTPSQSQEALEEEIRRFKKEKIDFIFRDKKYSIKVSDFSPKFFVAQTIKEAYFATRRGNIGKILTNQFRAVLGKIDVPLKVKLPKRETEKILEENFARFEIQPRDSKIEFKGNKYIYTNSRPGMTFSKREIEKVLEENLASLQNRPIILKLKKAYPRITEPQNKKAVQQANQVLERAPFLLRVRDKTLYLYKNDLPEFLKFREAPAKENSNFLIETKLVIDKTALEKFLMKMAPLFSTESVNARLGFDKERKVKILFPSQDGLKLNIQKTAEVLTKNILSLNRTTIAQTVIAKPPVRQDTLQSLGLEKLLGEGQSNFAGSPASRVHNIKVGSRKFDGKLIPPGKEFSFNQLLGKVGPEAGYMPELVIKKNKTIPEYGGGLCQVSTTLFRAAVFAGLKITERFPHSFPVSYYNPQGFDATIYPPHPDLRFINNTPAYIYIQSEVRKNKLYFYIFGKDDGRKAVVEGPKVLEERTYNPETDQSPPAYILKTLLVEKVFDKKGKLLFKQSFLSKYKSPKEFPREKNPLE